MATSEPHGRGSHLQPPNRFDKIHLEPVPEGPGDVATEFLTDQTRTVVTENQSPDIPFRYSLNPYRGCEHGCSYCMSGDTLVLMADGTTCPLANLRSGDAIYGTVLRGDYRCFVRTTVLAHWQTFKHAYRVRLADGTELVASGDHRFLTERGWKHVSPAANGQRPYLTLNNSLLGTGRFALGPAPTPDYQRGYLAGMTAGDGHLRVYDYAGRRRQHDTQYQFRLALKDLEALERTAAYLGSMGVETRAFLFQKKTEQRAAMHAIRTSSRAAFQQITDLIAWPAAPSLDWRKGFLAGLFDAEGCFHAVVRIFNSNEELLRLLEESLAALGFQFVYDVPKRSANLIVRTLRLRGGLRESLRFFHTVDNAILRKLTIDDVALKSDAPTRVLSIESLGQSLPMYDITTRTEDFIANGIVSHNCYARPTHEYLGLNAGLDFETKILVKEHAPALFRAFLNRPAWVPESITLSGVTDPYQPAERHFRLTRGCLEVAGEACQPLSLITKNALVERDLDLLRELAAQNLVHVHLSITTLDAELARVLEPRTSTPVARLRAVKTLADAGVPVCVLVAPVIPGLNDSEIPAILAAAREAGAHSAGYQLVRLPLTVAPVFHEWLTHERPSLVQRVEGRIRGVRGGRLNDASFGTRMTSTGEMAEQIGAMFRLFARRHGLDGKLPPYDCSRFRPPRAGTGQGWLF